MNSIRQKFTTLNLVIIFLCTFILGGTGVWFITRSQQEYSDELLQLTCKQEASVLNGEMTELERAVDICATQAVSRMPSLDAIRNHAEERAGYISEMEMLFGDVARHNKSVICYYLRLKPELAEEISSESGFFYTKKRRVETFIKQQPTPIRNYDPTDVEHVGWFYAPKEAEKAIWMEPYHNRNVDMEMISYVVPIYKDDEFVGVVGMDMDFDMIVNEVSVISPYKTGSTCLVSRDGKIYYHPVHASGTYISTYTGDLQGLVRDMKYFGGSSRAKKTYAYAEDGTNKKLVYNRLRNDMVMLLSVESAEIVVRQQTMLRVIGFAMLVIALFATLITLYVSSQIIRPLEQLTTVAEEIARGNLEVQLPKVTNDEVGILTKSFDLTLQSLKQYISGMRYKAFSDPLTHLKNMNAFEMEKERLQQQMQQGNAKYAILMLDTNDLKKVNDTYGHERGDVYLQTCSQLICKVFAHSPVFRIGGDEFVAILEHMDYELREALLVEFDRRAKETWKDTDAWKRVYVAKGLGVYDPSDTSVEDVQRRADAAMYENKKGMKAVW